MRTDCGLPRSDKAIDCTRCSHADENHAPEGACRVRGCYCERFSTKVCRWAGGEKIESPAKVEAFLDEIEAVCRKHGMSIEHEDGHGAFEIGPFDERNIKWLRGARLLEGVES